MPFARIVGVGRALPKCRVSNEDLAQRLPTSDAWIVSRTGIHARHVAGEEESVGTLAQQAVQRALEDCAKSASEVDVLIVATSTPEQIFPSTACFVQSMFPEMEQAVAFDIQAVCAGFVYALEVAAKFIQSGQYRCAVVVGADVFSRILNWEDRRTCVLFGDGAGAVVLEQSEKSGILGTVLKADGRYREALQVPAHLDRGEICGSPYIEMNGQLVFKFAIKAMEESIREVLAKSGESRIDWLVPHQANIRILEAVAERLGLSMQQVSVVIDRYGNTSAASVPLAFSHIKDQIRPGSNVVFVAMGGGFTWGAALVRF